MGAPGCFYWKEAGGGACYVQVVHFISSGCCLNCSFFLCVCENSSCCTWQNFKNLFNIYAILQSLCPRTLKYRALSASAFIVHRGSQCPWNRRSSSACGIPHSIYFQVKMTQHQGCFCQESGRWRLVAVGWFFLPGCVGSHPKYMTNPSREMRQWEGKWDLLLTYKCKRGSVMVSNTI